MQSIAIAGQKGGSGRSSSTYAIGSALVELGKRVLMVDCDPQASLTAACDVDGSGESLAEVMGGADAGQMPITAVLYEVVSGLDLVPSDIALASSELGMVMRMGRENVLKSVLAAVNHSYDFALLDCPPSLGLMTINALVAATGVVVPIQPQTNDIRALRLFIDTLEKVKGAGLNPNIELIGILPTLVDDRLIHHKEALQILEQSGLAMMPVTIARSVKVAEAAAGGVSIIQYDPNHKISNAYRQVAKELIGWQRRRRL